jgi:uncharacterized protein (TIGR02453 family)
MAGALDLGRGRNAAARASDGRRLAFLDCDMLTGSGFFDEADRVVDGGGVWMPPRPALLRIRDAIAEAPEVFTDLMHAPALKRRFGGLEREHMLQRMPRGYAPDHPAGEWLRFQSFTMGHALDEADLGSRTLVDLLVKDYTVLLPLVRWINSVSGLPEATRR